MRFVIPKQHLVRVLQTVTGVVEKRATLPILSNVLLHAQDDGLHVRASDLEVNVRSRTDASIVAEGTVTLPAAKLLELARSLPDADVECRVESDLRTQITCDRVRYKLSGLATDDFPAFPSLDVVPIELPGAGLRRMIERVAFAITDQDPRYSLNGAQFIVDKGGMTLVATDGHRLAYVRQETALDVAEPVKAIVPRKTLAEVLKLTSDLDDSAAIRFAHQGNHVFFRASDAELASTVPDGPFPNYENVMPESCNIGVPISRVDLGHAVRRVSLLASDRYGKAVRFALSSGKLELSYEGDTGEARESLSVDYDGDDVEIGFNPRYVQDFLSVVGTDDVRLELDPVRNDAGGGPEKIGDKPGQLRPEPGMDLDYRYIVMPMHLM